MIIQSSIETPEAKQAWIDLDTARLQSRIQNVSWLPGISLDAPEAFKAINITGERQFSAGAKVSVNQNLPGNGVLQAAISHVVAWTDAFDSFTQLPVFSGSVSQPVGPGIFGLYGDPGQGLSDIALEKAEITYRKTVDALFLKAAGIVRDADLAAADMAHKNALSLAAELARREREALFGQGRISRGEYWKTETSARTAARNAITARYTFETAIDAWFRFFGQGYAPVAESDRADILAIPNEVNDSIDKNTDYRLLRMEAEWLKKNRDLEILKRSPVLIMGISSQPDSLLNVPSSTLKDSFEGLRSSDMKWPVQVSVGVSVKLGFPFSDWYARDMSDLALEKNRLAASTVLEQDRQDRDRMEKRIEGLKALLAFLDEEAERSGKNAFDLEVLRDNGEITQVEYAADTAASLGFSFDRLSAHWEYIMANLEYAARF